MLHSCRQKKQIAALPKSAATSFRVWGDHVGFTDSETHLKSWEGGVAEPQAHEPRLRY